MKKIAVVGVGALGSHFIQFARNFEDCKLHAIDFDKVERKNVLSQFHTKAGVGKNKAKALQQAMNFVYGLHIEVIPHKLTTSNAKELLRGSALVVDCLDNGESRKVVQEVSRELKLPLLHGALAANGALGRVVWDNQFEIDYGSEGAATCEDGDHLPFITLVSSYLALSAQEYLTSNREMSFQVFPRSAAISI